MRKAAAQPTPDVRGLPPGEGSVRGRIVRSERPDAVAGLDVVLYALPEDGEPGLGRTQSDAQGRFAFDGLSTAPGTVYLLGAQVDGVPYGERFTFRAGDRERHVDLRVEEPSTDVAPIRRGASFLRIDRGCGSLRINEAHELSNPTGRVIRVPPGAREGRAPLARSPGGAPARPSSGGRARKS